MKYIPDWSKGSYQAHARAFYKKITEKGGDSMPCGGKGKGKKKGGRKGK